MFHIKSMDGDPKMEPRGDCGGGGGGGGGVNSSDGGPEPTYGDGDGTRMLSLGLCFRFCKNVFSRVNFSIFCKKYHLLYH